MANNEINEIGYVPKKEIRQLPDRSDLSELYYETKRGYQKGSVNYDGVSSEMSHAEYLRFINRNFAKIGVLFPLPVSIIIFLYDNFAGNSIKENDIFHLALIALIGIISLPIFVVAYKKIANILEKLGFGFLYFFIYLAFCLSLIYLPIFAFSAIGKNIVLVHVVAYLLVSAFCVATTKILLVALGDERINSRIRTLLKGVPLAICLIIAVIFGYFLF